MINENPLVSVIIPAYQSATILPRAIRSAVKQSYSNLEIIVVDNGSTDNTQSVVEKLIKSDGRIHLVRLEENKRPAGGRNAGVANSNGKYVAFLDADDEWLPTKIEEQVWTLENYPDIGMVISDGWIIDESTNKRKLYSEIYESYISRLLPEKLKPDIEIYRLAGPVRSVIYEKCIVDLSSVILRKDLFLNSGNFDERLFGPEDVDLWVRLAKYSHFAYLNLPRVNRYVSDDNLSNASEKWLLNVLFYYKICYNSVEYADLMPIIHKNLEKYYCYLLIFYGSQKRVKKSWDILIESFQFGFYPILFLYAALAPFGKPAYDFGVNVKMHLGLKDKREL